MCWYRPLTHTSVGFRVQRYNSPMQPFCVARIILQEIIKKKVVDSWNTLMIFNLSTLELDNGRNNYSLQDLGLLILQRSGCKPYMEHGIGCKMGATLKCEKKKSPVNHWFTGLFFFSHFKIAPILHPFLNDAPNLHPLLCRIPSKDSAKNNICEPLSSSNVNELKTSMKFQLSTTDNLKFVLHFARISLPLTCQVRPIYK